MGFGTIVTTKKDGGLHLCIDPKPINRALQLSTYYMPTIDDVLPKLANAKVFSTVDANSAFWMLTKLDECSVQLPDNVRNAIWSFPVATMLLWNKSGTGNP